MNQQTEVFIIGSAAILVFLPVFLAMHMFILDSQLQLFSVFLLFLMVSFLLGVKDDEKNPVYMNYILFGGIILAILQSTLFYSLFRTSIDLVTFPLYLWAWLSMYHSGLNVSTKKLYPRDVLHALITSLAGIGTLSWLWLTSFLG